MERSCLSCEWVNHTFDDDGDPHSECRWLPPIMSGPGEDGHLCAGFPPVGEDTWCAQWKAMGS